MGTAVHLSWNQPRGTSLGWFILLLNFAEGILKIVEFPTWATISCQLDLKPTISWPQVLDKVRLSQDPNDIFHHLEAWKAGRMGLHYSFGA